MDYTVKDLKDGKIVASFPDKESRHEFAEKIGLQDNPRCFCYDRPCPLVLLYVGYKGLLHGESPLDAINCPTVPYIDLLPVEPDDQIIAYYNSDGTVTCLHKRNDKVVQRETVKRYHKDADDLRVATKCALEKMLGGQEKGTQEFYRPGDMVLVRDDLVQYGAYGGLSWLPGMNEEISGVVTLGRKAPLGNFQVRGWYVSPKMFAGKIVPIDGLKAGDEVLVKDAEYLDCTVQKKSANKVIRIAEIDCACDAWTEDACFTPSLCFVGKLIRIPTKE